MTELKKDNDTYTLTGLSIDDLEMMQEGLHRLFNESQKREHRNFRRQVLQIDRAIDPALEKHFNSKNYML